MYEHKAVKKLYTDYKTLPDFLKPTDLEGYFNEFLNQYSNKPRSLKALKQLYELSYRQWDTYEVLAPEISQKINEYIVSSVNLNSYDIMDTIISIVENLFLKDAFDYIISKKDSVASSSVRRLISEAQEEYSESISNPYGDLVDF